MENMNEKSQGGKYETKLRKRITISLNKKDLQCIKEIASKKWLPYQTFISLVLHEYIGKYS